MKTLNKYSASIPSSKPTHKQELELKDKEIATLKDELAKKDWVIGMWKLDYEQLMKSYITKKDETLALKAQLIEQIKQASYAKIPLLSTFASKGNPGAPETIPSADVPIS